MRIASTLHLVQYLTLGNPLKLPHDPSDNLVYVVAIDLDISSFFV